MSQVPVEPRLPTLAGRAAAAAEVLVVFTVVHVAYRAFKRFTDLGRWESAHALNYSPGVTMIAAALLLIVVFRRRRTDYALTLANWPRSLALGLVFGLAAAIGAAAIVVFGGFQAQPGRPPPAALALVGAGGELLLTAGMLLSVRGGGGFYRRVPAPISIAVLSVICASPVLLALHSNRSPGHAAAVVGELLLGAGFGEELFFRGYVQSRLNTAFGRPFRLLGVRFGVGLPASAVLFGVIHALNTVDYFSGRFEFAWAWGVMNVGAGLLLGFMRERSGSILPGVIAHAVTDILQQVPAFLAAM